ncbi:MAG: ribonuclease P protein component [bacterium]
MISRSHKFPLRTQFLSFRAASSQTATPHLRLLTSPHTPSRLSVIVPLKVNKRAVVRNHLKRLVYDVVWKILLDKNIDCVIMSKPLALTKGDPTDKLILSELSSLHV